MYLTYIYSLTFLKRFIYTIKIQIHKKQYTFNIRKITTGLHICRGKSPITDPTLRDYL